MASFREKSNYQFSGLKLKYRCKSLFSHHCFKRPYLIHNMHIHTASSELYKNPLLGKNFLHYTTYYDSMKFLSQKQTKITDDRITNFKDDKITLHDITKFI